MLFHQPFIQIVLNKSLISSYGSNPSMVTWTMPEVIVFKALGNVIE